MAETAKLKEGLGLRDAIALVIGTIIGTGVFLKSGIMTQTVGSPVIVMIAWFCAGLLSLAGALTYAELGSLFPRAGGEYVYLKEAYGKTPAFLYGWMRFWIGSPGSIAAYAVGSATFLAGFLGPELDLNLSVIAISFIFIFTLLNCLNVQLGGGIQTFLTALKILVLLFLVVGIFLKSESASMSHFNESITSGWAGWSSFGIIMISALWAYDGWNNLPMVASEVKNSKRNVPLALILGTIAILILYGLVNFSYFYALPTSSIMEASSKLHPENLPVATMAANTFLGTAGIGFLSLAFVISALGAMNGSILTGARVPYAMAQDRLFFHQLALVNSKTHTPMRAIIVQGIWACVLAASGTFDQLTDYVVFSAWLFYALCGASIFIFRKKLPLQERSYKVLFYPILPIVFIAVAILLLLNTLWTSPQESLFGLLIIGVGWPAYYFGFRESQKPLI